MKRWQTILLGIVAGLACGEGIVAIGGPFIASYAVLGFCVLVGIAWPLE